MPNRRRWYTRYSADPAGSTADFSRRALVDLNRIKPLPRRENAPAIFGPTARAISWPSENEDISHLKTGNQRTSSDAKWVTTCHQRIFHSVRKRFLRLRQQLLSAVLNWRKSSGRWTGTEKPYRLSCTNCKYLTVE